MPEQRVKHLDLTRRNMAGGDMGKIDGKKRSNEQKKGTHDGCGDGKYNKGEESTNISW